jgi:hypothetical protein
VRHVLTVVRGFAMRDDREVGDGGFVQLFRPNQMRLTTIEGFVGPNAVFATVTSSGMENAIYEVAYVAGF